MHRDGGNGRQRPVDVRAGDVLFDMAVGLAPPERRRPSTVTRGIVRYIQILV